MKNYRKNSNEILYFSLITIFIALFINYLTTSGNMWSFNVAYGVLWLPLLEKYMKTNTLKLSILGSSMTMVYVFWVNYTTSWEHLWFLYVVFAVVWWPITMYYKKYLTKVSFSVISSLVIILSYLILNIFISPEYPWIIYIIFSILWWPISIYFCIRKKWFGFSLAGAILLSVEFYVINYITSFDEIWCVYPIFTVVWWPLSIYYYKVKAVKD